MNLPIHSGKEPLFGLLGDTVVDPAVDLFESWNYSRWPSKKIIQLN